MKKYLARVILLLSIVVASGIAVAPRAQAVDRPNLQRALLGTVRVAVKIDGETSYSTGSGTVVSEKGYIVSNFHVVGDTKTGKFYNKDRMAAIAINPTNLRGLPNWIYTARVVQADADLDISILKIVGLANKAGAALPANLGLTVVPLGDSDKVDIGDEVSILGFPGLGGDTVTFTQGRISGFLDEDNDKEIEWFKTDAEVNHGNSGGLAVNDKGEMIGIPTAGVSDREDIGKISLIRPAKLALPLIQAALRDLGGVDNGTTPTQTTGPRVSNVRFATAIDRDGNPVSPATRFASGAAAVYATFDYNEFKRGTKFVYAWSLDGETVADDSIAWKNAGSGNDWLSLSNNSKPLPDGKYELQIKIDGKTQFQGKFVVGGGQGTSAGAEKWGPITFAEAVDKNDRPARPGKRFASGVKEAYAFWDFSGMTDGAPWTRVWYLDDQEILRESDNWGQGESGSNWVSIYSKNALPDGTYKLELYLNDTLLQSGGFAVGSGEVQAPVVEDDGVQIYGAITDADTGRGISGAVFVVLKPGVTIDQWTKDFSESEIFATGTADASGNYQLSAPLARGQSYSMVVLAKSYTPASEDAVKIDADLESPHEMNVSLSKR